MLFIAQARKFGQPVQHLEGVRTLNTISGEAGNGPRISSPGRPSLFVELEHRNSGRESVALLAKVRPRDGAVEVQNGGIALRGDAEHHHALGHSGEEQVGLFNRPSMSPTVVLHK